MRHSQAQETYESYQKMFGGNTDITVHIWMEKGTHHLLLGEVQIKNDEIEQVEWGTRCISLASRFQHYIIFFLTKWLL